MNAKVYPSIRHDLSRVPIKAEMLFGRASVGVATAFFYRARGGQDYVITNVHVVTGRHRDTLVPLDTERGALPDVIGLQIPFVKRHPEKPHLELRSSRRLFVDLYEDEAHERPRWYEHPRFGSRVDVAAIPFTFDREQVGVVCGNAEWLGLRDDVLLFPGLDVYVLGFPRGLTGGMDALPIWKRATIASEPEFPARNDGLPLIYIDSATREGMSGSPVYVAERSGWIQFTADGNQGLQIGGEGRRFVGVYSSRHPGATEVEAQIGEVWPAPLIDEIIDGQRRPVSLFNVVPGAR